MINQWLSRWNSFNPMKALVHVPYWKKYLVNKIPPYPLTVSVDPCGICCLKCPHCNARKVIDKTNKMSLKTTNRLIYTLKKWQTKSICIGGGGESLLNENTRTLILKTYNVDIKIALITNGLFLDRFLDLLDRITYIGISVDAASGKIWNKLKGVRNGFNNVIKNMRLVRINHPNLDLTYKFLITPDNFHEVLPAIKLASEIGCTAFHCRPVGATWFELGKKYGFTENIQQRVSEEINEARIKYEKQNFRIYAVVSKFNDNWDALREFKKCWASFVTCTISPDGTIGLCCDRRGDLAIKLGNIHDKTDPWGSKKHIEIQKNIDVSKCPRCTYGHVNALFENIILKDNMFTEVF